MADPNFKKISDMAALTTAAADDIIPIVDVSEAADVNKNKKITTANLRKGITNAELAGSITAAKIAGISSDPNADRIVFWDDSATSLAYLAPGSGLAIADTTLALSHLGIQSLADPNADRIMFWDDSAGAMKWLTAGTGLAISGTTLNAADIGSGDIADGAVTTAKIANDAVTSAKIASKTIVAGDIADNTITALQLAAGSVDSSEIANGAIDLAHMSANSIDSDQYVDGSIDRVHLAADIVDGTKIADNSVNSEHYVDGSIDQEHLSVGASKVTNRQGGSATNWSVGGNTNYALSSARIQVGSFTTTVDYPGNQPVTYPVAFSQVPVLIISGAGYENQGISINTQTATGFTCSYTNPDIGMSDEVTVQWIAIGAA